MIEVKLTYLPSVLPREPLANRGGAAARHAGDSDGTAAPQGRVLVPELPHASLSTRGPQTRWRGWALGGWVQGGCAAVPELPGHPLLSPLPDSQFVSKMPPPVLPPFPRPRPGTWRRRSDIGDVGLGERGRGWRMVPAACVSIPGTDRYFRYS